MSGENQQVNTSNTSSGRFGSVTLSEINQAINQAISQSGLGLTGPQLTPTKLFIQITKLHYSKMTSGTNMKWVMDDVCRTRGCLVQYGQSLEKETEAETETTKNPKWLVALYDVVISLGIISALKHSGQEVEPEVIGALVQKTTQSWNEMVELTNTLDSSR